MHKYFVYLFLRAYGYMLGRSFRNSPEEACQDALTPFMIVVGLPTFCLLSVPLVYLYPQLGKDRDWVPWVAFLDGLGLFLSAQPLLKLAKQPELADKYRSKSSRRTTAIAYLGVLLGSIVISAWILGSLRSR
jgi:hypothetical protein